MVECLPLKVKALDLKLLRQNKISKDQNKTSKHTNSKSKPQKLKKLTTETTSQAKQKLTAATALLGLATVQGFF